MKIIRPVSLDETNIQNISVPEDDAPEYSATTTYARGDQVISVASHTLYRSLTDGNTGNDPDLEQVVLADPLLADPDPVNWQVISATNPWRLFDKKPSVQTEYDGQVSFTFTSDRFVTGIAGFNIECDTIRVRGVEDGAVTFERTINMRDRNIIGSWTDYFIQPFNDQREFVIVDLPLFTGKEILFEAIGTTGTKVGQVVIGDVFEIGTFVNDSSNFSGLDFSFVETDEFGNLTTNRRAATLLSDFTTVITKDRLDDFKNRMIELRGGEPAVWIGSEDERHAAINYGFYREFSAPYSTSEYSVVTIEVQGIV